MLSPSRRLRSLRAAVACATLLLLPAVPGTAAAAATIVTPNRCYVHWPEQGSQSIPVALSGLTPGQQVRVQLQIGGTTVSSLPSLTVDSTGSLITELANWTSGLGDGPTKGVAASVVVSDFVLGTPLASAPVKVANAGLDIDASTKRYGTKRRWVVSGLSRLGGGKTYYAFYFKGKKQVGKQKLGRSDACGYLRVKALLIPFVKVGTYQLRVQASRRFSRDLAWVGGSVEQAVRR